jgi:protein TonB
MYLFNDYEQGLGRQYSPSLGGAAPLAKHKTRALIEALTGEEKPRSIGGLLFILVLLLHVRAALWLSQPQEPVTPAQPLMMEVSLVSAPGPKASTAPPAPPKPVVEPPKPVVEPPKPKKTPVKKPLKKKTPVKPKQATPPKVEAIAREMLPAPSPVESAAESAHAKDASSVPVSASRTQSREAPYTEARVNANYGSNPPPKYPAIAKRRGWQGTVRLRVSVTAEGYSEAIAVQSSSGYEELDEAAIAAVEKWQFIPAKRGDTAVASSVIVPIIFKLDY